MAVNSNNKVDKYMAEEAMFQTSAMQSEDMPNYAGVAGKVGGFLVDAFKSSRKANTAEIVNKKNADLGKPEETALDPEAANMISQDLMDESQQADIDNTELPLNADVSAVDPEQVLDDVVTGDVPTDKYTERGSINMTRSHEGSVASASRDLENAKSADEVNKVLNSISRQLDMKTIRPYTEIVKAGTDAKAVYDTLEPILLGKQTGLMNSDQLYAARVLVATQSQKISEIVDVISGGDHSPEALGVLLKEVSKGSALVKMTQGNTSEIARALSSLNIVPQTLDDGSLLDFNKMLEDSGGAEDIVAMAMAMQIQIKNVKDGKVATIGALTNDRAKSFIGAANEFWKAQILSGVPTQVVNLSSNAVWGGWETYALRPVAATIGELKKKVDPALTDYVSFDESAVKMAASVDGILDGFGMAARAFMKDDSLFGGTKTDADGEIEQFMNLIMGDVRMPEVASKPVVKGVSAAATVPFRLLTTGDEFFKTIHFKSELAALAAREGKMKGLDREDLLKHIETVMANPSNDMYQEAINASKESTFTGDELGGIFGSMADGAKKLTQTHPLWKWVFPFISTPSNIMAKAMETSALSVISPKLWREINAGGARADMAQAKIVTGMAFTMAAYGFYQQGLISGAGPRNKDLRKAMEKEGWQANSIKVGDQYIAYDRFEPLGAALGMWANLLDHATYSESEQDFQEMMLYAGFSAAEYMADAPMMSGLNTVMDAIRYKTVDRLMANYASSMTPYSGFRKAEARVDDTTKRVPTRDPMEKSFSTKISRELDQALDMLSKEGKLTLRPARYWDGSLQTDPSSPAFIRMGIKTSVRGERDPVNAELIRNGYGPSEPSPIMSLGGTKFSIVEMDMGEGMIYDEMIKRVGEQRKIIMGKLIENRSYQKLDAGLNSYRSEELRSANAKATNAGMLLFLKHDLEPALRKVLEGGGEISEMGHYFLLEGRLTRFIKGLHAQASAEESIIEDFNKKVKVKGHGSRSGLPVPFEKDRIKPMD